jgi:hypothetical protein
MQFESRNTKITPGFDYKAYASFWLLPDLQASVHVATKGKCNNLDGCCLFDS